MKKVSSVLLGLAVAFSIEASPAFDISPAHAGSKFPSCDDAKVTKKLLKRFNKTEKIYWQERGLQLSGVSDRHFHTDYTLPNSKFDRRFCHGTAEFTDGSTRRIHYLIESNAGFAGFTWNVEYCIHGLDPYRYYDGRCRHLSRQTSARFP